MARKGQGKLKQALEVSDSSVPKTKASLSPTKCKGQEVTGVTLPVEVRTYCIDQLNATIHFSPIITLFLRRVH
jgi:hypothetical protein